MSGFLSLQGNGGFSSHSAGTSPNPPSPGFLRAGGAHIHLALAGKLDELVLYKTKRYRHKAFITGVCPQSVPVGKLPEGCALRFSSFAFEHLVLCQIVHSGLLLGLQ